MRLLLDTHSFLWWCADAPQLTRRVRRAVADGGNDVFVSAVNGWEIAIKSRLGKLSLPTRPDRFMRDMLARHAFGVLPITLRHALGEHDLPEHHSDPFDRLLVSQALVEGLTLVTNDERIRKYGAEILW